MSGRKPKRFHFSRQQPRSHTNTLCSVEPTYAGGSWRLTSLVHAPAPPPIPQTFLDVLHSWGNTWLWNNLSISGGVNWLQDAIKEDTLVAVTDGLYIHKLYPNLCSAVFVLECAKGRGQMIGSFSESLMVANAYRGEILGFIAIHLILLSINKINCNQSVGVEIVSDCLGALKRVTSLLSYRIPSRYQHSDILKNLLVNCRDLSFTLHYSHVKAHQDDSKFFKNLSRKAQLNCIYINTAKQHIVINREEGPTTGQMFPLKPIGIFIKGEKLTSKTGDQLWFWAHLQLARIFHAEQGIMTHRQFDEMDWRSAHRTLHDLAWLFQVWAAKHVLNIAGTTKFLLYQDGWCKLCPSCQKCKETCHHVARCPEKGRAMAFDQSPTR